MLKMHSKGGGGCIDEILPHGQQQRNVIKWEKRPAYVYLSVRDNNIMAIALKYIDEGFRSLSVHRPLLIGLPESSIPYISVVVLYFSGRRCRQQRVASQLCTNDAH